MKVFKILNETQYSSVLSSHEGVFVLNEDSLEFRGYIEEKYSIQSHPVKSIYGMYNESKHKMAYLKLSDSATSIQPPVLYVFHNTKKSGKWCVQDDLYKDFFVRGNEYGICKIRITEVTEASEKAELSKRAIEYFNKALNVNSNMMLIYKGVEEYL